MCLVGVRLGYCLALWLFSEGIVWALWLFAEGIVWPCGCSLRGFFMFCPVHCLFIALSGSFVFIFMGKRLLVALLCVGLCLVYCVLCFRAFPISVIGKMWLHHENMPV